MGSEQAELSIKARMKAIRSVSVSCKDLSVGNPFGFEEKGMKLENSINVRISYNGYKNIKIVLKQNNGSDSKESGFAFYHEDENVNKKIKYSISFNETKLPLIDGVVFCVDSSIINPIIDETIGLDLHIHPFKNEKALAGKYTTSLQVTIMEVE